MQYLKTSSWYSEVKLKKWENIVLLLGGYYGGQVSTWSKYWEGFRWPFFGLECNSRTLLSLEVMSDLSSVWKVDFLSDWGVMLDLSSDWGVIADFSSNWGMIADLSLDCGVITDLSQISFCFSSSLGVSRTGTMVSWRLRR